MAPISIPSSLPPEVLNSICHAILRPHRQEGLASLASLARTCRLFHEPAVSAIWERIPNIIVLIRTLPRDLWLETPEPVLGGRHFPSFKAQLSFNRPPVQTDFARLRHYAHHIRHTTQRNTCFVSPGILDALAIHFPAGTLLPNILTLIYWHPMCLPSAPIQSLEVFFSPKLHSVELVSTWPRIGRSERVHAEDFDCIRALPSMCPYLSVIQVRMESSRRPLVTVLPAIIVAFHNLTHAHMGSILLDFPAIVHLARFPSLQVLDACLSDKFTQDDVQSLTSALTNGLPYFPSLEKISLDHYSLSLPTSLLKAVSSCTLEDVTFSNSKQAEFNCTSEDVSELCRELSRHTLLTHITVSVTSLVVRSRAAGLWVRGSRVVGARFDRATFEPLLTLHNLTHLDLAIPHPIDVDDALIAAMAFAWRKLVKFSLCVARPGPGVQLDPFALNQRVTPFSLLSFVEWCPELVWIGLPINTDPSQVPGAVYRSETRPGGGKALMKVAHLDVGMSVVRDPVPLAAFLSDLFPRLEMLHNGWLGTSVEDMSADLIAYAGLSGGEIMRKWDEVSEWMEVFTNMREEERKSGATHGKGQSVFDV